MLEYFMLSLSSPPFLPLKDSHKLQFDNGCCLYSVMHRIVSMLLHISTVRMKVDCLSW